MIILLPALLVLLFLGVQAAMLYQGRTVALAAAQEGARDAAAENGSASAGISTARTFINTSTAGLSGTNVAGSRTATVARVSVVTHTVSVIPGWKPTIRQSATLPVERLTG